MVQRVYRGEAGGIPVDGGSVIWAIKQHGIRVITPAQGYATRAQATDDFFAYVEMYYNRQRS
jgi:hypothetical protein